MARESAQADAVERLSERIEQLRLSEDRRVRDFIATAPEAGPALRSPFPGVYLSQARFTDDQICTVRAEVLVNATIEFLKRLNRQYGDGRYRDRDFDRIRLVNRVERLVAVGQGVPLLHDTPRHTAPAAGRRPEWAGRKHRETGHGVPPRSERNDASRKLIAARRAGEEARGRLERFARALPLVPGGDVTVGDEVDKNPAAAARLRAWVASAKKVRTQWDRYDGAEIVIEADLGELWQAVAPRYRTPPPDEPQIRFRGTGESKDRSRE